MSEHLHPYNQEILQMRALKIVLSVNYRRAPMGWFCAWFASVTNSRQAAAAPASDVRVLVKLFRRVGGFRLPSPVILRPGRHDRRGPVVRVPHPERQRTAQLHTQRKQRREEPASPFPSRRRPGRPDHIPPAVFPAMSQRHFRTTGGMKNLGRRNPGVLHSCGGSPANLLFKAHLPGT